jgi:CRISPR-associated protein Cmr6
LVVGLGGEHTLETAITLHRNYGIPIIPGSAVKGVARAYAFFTLAEELTVQAVEPDEFKRRRIKAKLKQETPLSALQGLLDANQKDWDKWTRKIAQAGGPQLNVAQLQTTASVQQFRQTFGWLGHAGGAIFFDAIPVTRLPQIVVDVMNPHYPEYYAGAQPPHDAQKPNPITFLVVDTGARFQFAVAPNRYPADEPYAELGKKWLTRALQWLGIGGKTMSGYGLFGAPEK